MQMRNFHISLHRLHLIIPWNELDTHFQPQEGESFHHTVQPVVVELVGGRKELQAEDLRNDRMIRSREKIHERREGITHAHLRNC